MEKSNLLIVLSIALFLTAGVIFAKDDPQGDPFKAVWDAIHALRKEQLHLYDGGGQHLGKFLTGNATGIAEATYDTYIESVNGIIKVYALPRNQKIEPDVIDPKVYFEGRDCTGNAFGSAPVTQTPHLVTRVIRGRYYMGTDDKGTMRLVRSTSQASGVISNNHFDGYEFHCHNYDSPMSVMTYALREITMPFKEPLAWPLEIKDH